MCSLLSINNSLANPYPTDTIQTKNGSPLSITFIKHASLMLNYEGHTIAIDPVSSYGDYSTLPKADLILITHEHQDHLDTKAIDLLEKSGTIIISNENSHQIIGKGLIMKDGETRYPTDYLTIEAVPAYNTTPDHLKYHPKFRDNGYVLTLGGSRIYIAGDTEDIPEMSTLKNIDVAFLPVNQPYTMTIDQADHAARMINPTILYPYHFGDTPIEQLKEKLKDTPIEVRIQPMP